MNTAERLRGPISDRLSGWIAAKSVRMLAIVSALNMPEGRMKVGAMVGLAGAYRPEDKEG